MEDIEASFNALKDLIRRYSMGKPLEACSSSAVSSLSLNSLTSSPKTKTSKHESHVRDDISPDLIGKKYGELLHRKAIQKSRDSTPRKIQPKKVAKRGLLVESSEALEEENSSCNNNMSNTSSIFEDEKSQRSTTSASNDRIYSPEISDDDDILFKAVKAGANNRNVGSRATLSTNHSNKAVGRRKRVSASVTRASSKSSREVPDESSEKLSRRTFESVLNKIDREDADKIRNGESDMSTSEPDLRRLMSQLNDSSVKDSFSVEDYEDEKIPQPTTRMTFAEMRNKSVSDAGSRSSGPVNFKNLSPKKPEVAPRQPPQKRIIIDTPESIPKPLISAAPVQQSLIKDNNSSESARSFDVSVLNPDEDEDDDDPIDVQKLSHVEGFPSPKDSPISNVMVRMNKLDNKMNLYDESTVSSINPQDISMDDSEEKTPSNIDSEALRCDVDKILRDQSSSLGFDSENDELLSN